MLRSLTLVLTVGVSLLFSAGVAANEVEDQPFDTAPVIEAPVDITSYDVVLQGAPDDAVAADLEAALALFRYRDGGAPSVALLRRRALDDRAIAEKVLRSHGYYEARVRAEVEAAAEGKAATVTVTVIPGRPFRLERHDFVLAPTALAQALPDAKDPAFGSPLGKPAAAAAILDAEDKALGALKAAGFPYASAVDRDAVADPAAATLAVTTTIDTGPRLTFGDLRIDGAEGIDTEYLHTYRPWQPGDPVDARKLTAYQRSLMQTGLFNAGAVLLPEEAPPPGPVPVTANLEPRAFRSIAVGVNYSTDLGPGGEIDFEHRNLFGANEILRVEANAALAEQTIETRLRKPQFRRNRQDLVTLLSLRHVEADAYDETGATLTVGLERRLGQHWLVGLGGLGEVTDTVSSDAEGRSYLLGLPGFVEYDNTGDLLNPAGGVRVRLNGTPFAGQFDGRFTPFFSTEVNASTYFDLTGEKRYVAALRTRLGSILSGDISDVPAGRRLYAGGGGSIRGYAERSIGPLDANNDPTGGRSVVEAVAELRAQFYGDFGAAVFVGAGSVTEDVAPTFSEGLLFAAGLGFRYHTPLGPIRADVAVPLNPRSIDDSFQLYFSIGQAF